MEINTIIEVQAFSDFNIKYTDCIMVHSDKLNTEEIFQEFYKTQGIESNTGLDYRELYKTTKDFIAFLFLKGFKSLNTEKIYFCD